MYGVPEVLLGRGEDREGGEQHHRQLGLQQRLQVAGRSSCALAGSVAYLPGVDVLFLAAADPAVDTRDCLYQPNQHPQSGNICSSAQYSEEQLLEVRTFLTGPGFCRFSDIYDVFIRNDLYF